MGFPCQTIDRSGNRRTLFAAGPLGLGGKAVSDQPVLGLKALEGLGRLVDESKAGALATTVLRAESEY